jgi:hypothetical protein
VDYFQAGFPLPSSREFSGIIKTSNFPVKHVVIDISGLKPARLYGQGGGIRTSAPLLQK